MAKDDYDVIVYQILAYLYTQLKNGDPVDPEMLQNKSILMDINERYWEYVLENLLKYGYIEGIKITKLWGNQKTVSELENCMITPTGIEYLCDNSFLQKAKEYLKDIKAIVPFV